MAEMDPEHSVDGAGRLARYLATKHSNLYTTVGQECGCGLVGIMGEVEAAAMLQDARLLDHQARLILKHLRCYFQSQITNHSSVH